jgi:predicted enzyme related to lactoylglutathione lyase
MSTPRESARKRLPAKPSIENLKKQAKKLAKDQPTLSLQQAQHQLAKSYGFPNWDELLVEATTLKIGKPSSHARQFFQASPVFHVPQPGQTAAYYRDKLGFQIAFGTEEGARYVVVRKENAAIHFTNMRDGGPPGGVHVLLWVGDVDALHEEFKQRGANIISPPRTFPYHLREMEVADPNGVRLIFAQDVD